MRYLLLIIGICIFATVAEAEIFACRDGDVTVFRDHPCDEEAEQYVPDGAFSVVAASDRIDAVAKNNREYLDARRRERRQAAVRAREQAEQLRRVNAGGARISDSDRRHTVRRITSEASVRTAGGEATPRVASETTPRVTSEAEQRTTSEATSRTTSEATARTHGSGKR